MKVCPRCQSRFEDGFNFCLNDGVTLIAEQKLDKEKTLSFSDEPTIETKTPLTANNNADSKPINYQSLHQKTRRGINPLLLVGGIVAVIVLIFAALFGAVLYLKSKIGDFPTPTPRVSYTPYNSRTPFTSPTPEEKPQLKIESAGQVKGSFGQQFLKFMVTNPTEEVILNPGISVTLYQGDVKLKDLSGESKLKLLKPGQTVPIWIDLFLGSDKFTDTKTATSGQTRFAIKAEDQLFPKLTITDTKMVVTRETSMFNNYQYAENWYTVSGVAQNTDYDTVSVNIAVIYYDENSNIIGIENHRISSLKRGEKEKFDTGAGEISSLFGKAKKFEIIVTGGSFF